MRGAYSEEGKVRGCLGGGKGERGVFGGVGKVRGVCSGGGKGERGVFRGGKVRGSKQLEEPVHTYLQPKSLYFLYIHMYAHGGALCREVLLL